MSEIQGLSPDSYELLSTRHKMTVFIELPKLADFGLLYVLIVHVPSGAVSYGEGIITVRIPTFAHPYGIKPGLLSHLIALLKKMIRNFKKIVLRQKD